MDSKKKMLISISSLVLVVVAVVVAVVAVLAAQKVTIKNSVQIGYIASPNVKGTVYGDWGMIDKNTKGELPTVTFDGTEVEETEKAGGDIKGLSFTKENFLIDIKFRFTNASDLFDYTATLKATNKGTNVKIECEKNEDRAFFYVHDYIVTDGVSITVPKGGTGTLLLRIVLDDATSDALFEADLIWELVASDRT